MTTMMTIYAGCSSDLLPSLHNESWIPFAARYFGDVGISSLVGLVDQNLVRWLLFELSLLYVMRTIMDHEP